MPELMKKSDTGTIVNLKFTGPGKNKDKAIRLLKELGFADTSDSVSWRDAFPEYDDDDLPGVCLSSARDNAGISQRKLSELTGIPQRHISEMENGKRTIGKKNALKLAEALNTSSYKVFL